MHDLEKRISAIEERNKRVEIDKIWETSVIRRALLLIITYILVGFYLKWLKVSRPWLNALVPAMGFLISTLALHKIKELWIRKR